MDIDIAMGVNIDIDIHRDGHTEKDGDRRQRTDGDKGLKIDTDTDAQTQSRTWASGHLCSWVNAIDRVLAQRCFMHARRSSHSFTLVYMCTRTYDPIDVKHNSSDIYVPSANLLSHNQLPPTQATSTDTRTCSSPGGGIWDTSAGARTYVHVCQNCKLSDVDFARAYLSVRVH